MQNLVIETSGAPLALRVSSELMKNQAAGSVLAVQAGMRAVRDANGQSILLYLDDGALCAVIRSAESRTGWRRLDLTSGLGLRVHAFDVGQLADDRIILAVAAAPAATPAKRRLHVTTALANDPAASHWNDMDGRWFARAELPEGAELVSIRIGAGTSQELPIGVAAVRLGDVTEQYLANLDARDDRWTWSRFELPNNASGDVQLAAGAVDGDRGVFALYDTSTGQTLEFTTLPGSNQRSERYLYALRARATCLAVLPSASEESSDVYVAGEAIHVFPAATTDAPIELAARGKLPTVYELAVTQDAERASVFALAGDQCLLHVEGPRAAFAKWTRPLQILSGVTSAAIVRGAGGNELFVAMAGKPGHVYQDPETKLWKATEIQLPSHEHVATFTTYTTRIEVADGAKRPCIAQTFELRADSRTQLFVNGRLHLAGPSHAVAVETDATGALTLVLPVDDLATPTLRLRVEGGADVELRPSHELETYLAGITDLGEETLHDGTKLIAPGSISADTLAATRDAARNILAATGGKPLLRAAPNNATYVLSFIGSETRLSVHGDGLLRAGGDSWVPDWVNAIEVEAGNALAWMSERLDDAARFVWRMAGKALEVLVEIGVETYKFMLHNLETGLRAISWVLHKALGIDTDRLWRWLGFVFDWTEIDRLRGTILRDVTAALTAVVPQLETVAKRVDEELENLRALLPQIDPSLVPATLDEVTAKAEASANEHPTMREAQSSPATNWAISHLLHDAGGVAFGGIAPTIASGEQTAAELVELWRSLGPARDVLVADLEAVFSGTLDLRAALAKLGSDVGFVVLEGLRALAAKVFAVLREGFAHLVTALTTPMPIPFFRGFLGRDISILDLAALVVAAPTSIAHRILTDQPTFEPAGGLLRASAAADPTYFNAWAYVWSSVVYDAANVVGAGLAVAPLLQFGFDLVRFAFNVVRLHYGKPSDDGSRQAPWQHRAWSTYATALGVDCGVWLLMVGVHFWNGREPEIRDKRLDSLGRARGAFIIGAAAVAGIFEAITLKIDFEVYKSGHPLTDVELKAFQNFGYFVADLTSGLLGVVGSKKALKLLRVLGGASAVAALGAASLNFIRVWMNEDAKHAHKNY